MLTTFLNKFNKYCCDSSVNSAQMKNSTFEGNMIEKPRKKWWGFGFVFFFKPTGPAATEKPQLT